MLLYNLRLSWISLRRTPFLSALAVGAIGIGIAVAVACTTIYYLLAKDPLPGKSQNLHYVRLDSWNPSRPFSDNFPERPPDQVTWRDAMALLESDIPAHKTATFRANLVVRPEAVEQRPFGQDARFCTRDFFPMFEVPFRYGGPWGPEADKNAEQVVVISAAANDRLFGGGDSVGKKLWLERRTFTVAGVLDTWRPPVRFFDPQGDAQGPPEDIYMPISLTPQMEIQSAGNRTAWGPVSGDSYADFLQSEVIWMQFWAELATPEQKEKYQGFVDNYTDDQKKLGRFGRPRNNWLQPMMAYLEEQEAVPPAARSVMVISLLFLLVVAINLIGLLLGKFLAKAPEVAVRRALGASRRAIFAQQITECLLIGVLGGVLGTVSAAGFLVAMSRFLEESTSYQLDLSMIAAGFGLALLAGTIAGVYPAWRVCAEPPANHLKTN